MNEPGETVAFLAAIETMLRDKVLPSTAGEARFNGLMVASAMGMARRAVQLETQLANARYDVIGLAPKPSPFEDPSQAIVLLLREGLLDGQDDVYRRLSNDAITRTAVTRPQVLSELELREIAII
jgi:hypothetical protein